MQSLLAVIPKSLISWLTLVLFLNIKCITFVSHLLTTWAGDFRLFQYISWEHRALPWGSFPLAKQWQIDWLVWSFRTRSPPCWGRSILEMFNLVRVLVLLYQLFHVWAGIAVFLLADIEDDLRWWDAVRSGLSCLLFKYFEYMILKWSPHHIHTP